MDGTPREDLITKSDKLLPDYLGFLATALQVRLYTALRLSLALPWNSDQTCALNINLDMTSDHAVCTRTRRDNCMEPKYGAARGARTTSADLVLFLDSTTRLLS